MKFICNPCAEAADIEFVFNLEEVRRQGHAKCKGKTWCDCQHRVERRTVVK